MSESLFLIEQTLQDLADERALAESEGDTEAVIAMDKCIAEYLTREAAKVTSYVNLIRSREMTLQACDQEIARLKAIKKAAEDDVERLKQTAMETMNRFGVRELKAKPGGGLRIQGNGGKQELEIPYLNQLPVEYRLVSVTMLESVWDELLACDAPGLVKWREWERLPNTEAIREALKQRVPCPQCSGEKTVDKCGCKVRGGEFEGMCSGEHAVHCERCKGSGTIPASVPGARLLPKGEHLRVS